MIVNEINGILFSLIRSALTSTQIREEKKILVTNEGINDLLTLAIRHDIAQLVVLGLKKTEC